MDHARSTANHYPFADVYTDATERLAATGFERQAGGGIVAFDAEDVGKFALQLSDFTVWMLSDHSPITWLQITGTGGITVDNSSIENNAGTLRLKDAGVTDAKLATSYTKADGTRAFTGDQSMGNHKLTNVTDPASAQDAATKAYVDTLASGLDFKGSVRAATTANITLSGEQTIDGVAVVTGNRVLVKNQTSGSENGIYVCASGAWSRASDADSSAEVTPGMFVVVEEGSTLADTGWLLTTNATITLGTTALVFTQFPSAATGMTNPMTTAGDLIKGGASGTPQRLAIGAEGQALRSIGGAPAWADLPTPGGTLNDPLGILMQVQSVRTGGGSVLIGCNATNTSGSNGAAPDADGMFESWTSSAVINNDSGRGPADSTADMTQTRYGPIFYFKGKPADRTTDVRWFIGLTSNGGLNMASDTPASHYAGFRFSPAAGDTNIQSVSDDGGSAPTVTDSGVAFVATNAYTLKVDCSDPASIKFYVNGVLKATHTTNLPGTTTSIGWWSKARNLATTAIVIKINRMVLSMP